MLSVRNRAAPSTAGLLLCGTAGGNFAGVTPPNWVEYPPYPPGGAGDDALILLAKGDGEGLAYLFMPPKYLLLLVVSWMLLALPVKIRLMLEVKGFGGAGAGAAGLGFGDIW